MNLQQKCAVPVLEFGHPTTLEWSSDRDQIRNGASFVYRQQTLADSNSLLFMDSDDEVRNLKEANVKIPE